MMSKKQLYRWIGLLAAVLLIAACGVQARSNSSSGSQPEAAAAQSNTDSQSEDAHARPAGHAAEAGHSEEASHAQEAGPAEELHAEGDAHAPGEHMAEAGHMEGDAHAPGEHMAESGHKDGDGHQDHDADHGEAQHHNVPAEALTLVNPVPSTDASIAAGAATYTQLCAVCHGPEGQGDGPGAVALDPKPANFSEEHVQVLSDGGLFQFITNGSAGTAMPPWKDVLSETQRWELVNFLRTFKSH